LERLQWIDLKNFEMQLINLQSSSIWSQKFIDLGAELENIERDRLVNTENCRKLSYESLEFHS
jgi:hypothetical protein